MPGSHRLHGLALAAVGSAPQRPVVTRADGVHGVPELRGYSRIRRIFEHAPQPAAFDLPPDLTAKLEVVALVVDRPRSVGLHEDAVVSAGDQLVKRQRIFSWQNADVGHADEWNPVPAFSAHRAVGAGLTDGVRRLAGRNVSSEEAFGDDGRALRLNAFVIVGKCAKSGPV